MKIETKYEHRDELWYMLDNKPTKITVTELLIKYTYAGYTGYPGGWEERAYPKQEFYAIHNHGRSEEWIHVSKLFKTKEDLLNSLL